MECCNLSLILGEDIAKIRKTKKMTQKKLCAGICSQGTISLIEKGEVIPGIEIIMGLAIRLNVPITHFITIIQSENIYTKYDLINEIEKLMQSQQYQRVYEITLSEMEKKDHNNWFSYYFKWLHFLSGYYIKSYPLEKALLKIKELYNSAPEFELNKDSLSDRMVNSIAILYAFKQDFKSALFYFNKIDITFKKRVEVFDFNKIQLRILYNKVKTLFDMELLENTIAAAKLGIEQSIKIENMSLIGNFYYYLGEAYENLGYPAEEISLSYKRALHFFEVLNKASYIEILKKDKAIYLKRTV